MKTNVMVVALIAAFLVGSALPVFAQSMSKQDYLDKSRMQKNTGFIMLGGGVAMATAGAILFNKNFNLNGGGDAEGIMMVAGTLVALGSIPMFISSGNNARKAAQMSFRNEPLHIPKYAGNLPRSVPSLTLKIPLD
jgi:hypothetical protein